MKNKKISPIVLSFSILLSFAIVIGNKIVFQGKVYANNYLQNNYSVVDILFGIFIIFITYFAILYLKKICLEKSEFIFKNESKNKFNFCFFSLILFCIVFFTYFLTFYPGGIYADTQTSLYMMAGLMPFTSHHPVLYTLSTFILVQIEPFELAVSIFALLQIIFMLSVMVYFVYWLLKNGINKYIVIAITFFLVLFKLYPLYSISLWKDTPFSLALFLYTLTFIDLILEFNSKQNKLSTIIKFNIFTILVIFLRNNGIFITIISSLFLLFTNLKYILENRKSYFSCLITIFISMIITALFPVMGISNGSICESLGIPMQQIAYVVAHDKNITEEQLELVNKVLPISDLKANHYNMIVDGLKWALSFDEEYLVNNMSDYFKLYIELFLQNPKEYIEAYLLQTSGFWSFTVNGDEAYINHTNWYLYRDFKNKDLIQEATNISFSNILTPKCYFSSGLFFWITLLSFVLTSQIANKKYLLGYLPLLILWATIMIATPLAVSLRYVFVLVLAIPLNIVYPFIAKKSSDSINQL